MARTLAGAVRKLKPIDAGGTDRDLLERYVASRDDEAFAALVRRHGRTVLAACRQVLADPADVDDAFQATFVVLMKKAGSVARGPGLGSWLYAVAHRLAVNARSNAARRAAREAAAGRRRATEAAPPDLSWREAVAILHEELDRLPDRYRRVLLLCYFEGKSRDEAAASLGVQPGAVKGRRERGRGLLVKRLAGRGVTLSAGLMAALAAHANWAVGGPSPELIEQTARACDGGLRPSVAALVYGVTPAVVTTRRVLAALAVLTAGGFVGFGGSFPPPDPGDKPAVTKGGTQKAGPPATAAKPEAAERMVRGTVADADGRPVDAIERHLLEFRSRYGKEAVTDADGRFTIGQLIPGRKFYLYARTKGGVLLAPKPRTEATFTVKVGETTDCGAVSLPASE